MARKAFALTFRGSRDDLAAVTAQRVAAVLLLLWLTGRCAHLAQAGIDLAVGGRAYTHPALAFGLAAACAVESVLVATVMLRAERLELGPLLGDAIFGIAGLLVMSAATSGVAGGYTGSLNWMLPYTVAAAVGIGLLPASRWEKPARAGATWSPGPDDADEGVGATKTVRRGLWLLTAVQMAAAGSLAAAYLLAGYLWQRYAGGAPGGLWADAANYAGFFLVAVALAYLLRRWLALIGDRNAEAARLAAEVSRDAQRQAVRADVFGPVLDLLDDLESLSDQVPVQMRAEAGRLIELIKTIKPPATGPSPGWPDQHAGWPDHGSPA